MVRVLSNNPNRGSSNWRRFNPGRLARRSIRTLMKTDPSVAQGVRETLIAQGVAATLTTAMAGADNDILFTAKELGVGGNNVRVRFVNPGGTVGRSIVVAGQDITVNLAVTAGAINGTETATSIVASINADATANKLVTAAVATGNSGAGVVAAFAYTNLAGGITNFSANRQFGGSGAPSSVGTVSGRFEDKQTAAGSGVTRIRDRGRNTSLTKR